MIHFFADTCYTENDAYNIATHGVKCHSIGEEVSDEKESKKVIYEEVEREDWVLELPNTCALWLICAH